MIVYGQSLKCTAKKKPNHWKMDDGREGVSYKVELSDGTENTLLQCVDDEVYNMIEPWKDYNVEFELVGTNFNGRSGVKCWITRVQLAD